MRFQFINDFLNNVFINKLNSFAKPAACFVFVLYFASFAENTLSINRDGHAGLVSVYSGRSLGKSRLVITSYADFTSDKKFINHLAISDTFAGDYDTVHPIGTLMTIRPNIAFGLTDFFDIGLSLPVYFDIMEGYSPEGGFGDLKFSTQFRLPGVKDRISDIALLAAATFPSGSKSSGYFTRSPLYIKKNQNSDTLIERTSCYSSKSVDFDIEALWRLNAGWFGLYLNSGCIFTTNSSIDNMLVIRGALELKPSEAVSVFAEVSSEAGFKNVSDGFSINRDPLWITPGVALTTHNGATLTFSGGFNVASGKDLMFTDKSAEKRFSTAMQPSWRVAVQLGWNGVVKNSDSDRDMVFDDYDKCPKAMEDIDGFDDHDGCPELDNDTDAIVDSLDKCPDEKEDVDNFDDTDGCPDWDNDSDHLPDTLDKCPDQPEDLDGISDKDGCPDYDNDFDGVPDSLDKCLNSAEDKDNFEDADGCPDKDNDGDGIADSTDRCPDQAGISDDGGCPKQKEKAKEIKMGKIILAGVGFEPKTARIVESAHRVLDLLYESLADYTDVKIEVRSHTDTFGGAASNLELTQKRAEVVVEYLVSKGISKDRLIPVGKGDSEPIADNRALPGRQLNNRIEIFRTN